MKEIEPVRLQKYVVRETLQMISHKAHIVHNLSLSSKGVNTGVQSVTGDQGVLSHPAPIPLSVSHHPCKEQLGKCKKIPWNSDSSSKLPSRVKTLCPILHLLSQPVPCLRAISEPTAPRGERLPATQVSKIENRKPSCAGFQTLHSCYHVAFQSMNFPHH